MAAPLSGLSAQAKPPKPNTAAQIQSLRDASQDLRSARAVLLNPDGSVNRSILVQGRGGIPGEGRQALRQFERALESRIRALSGQQVTDSEMARQKQQFVPAVTDSDAEIVEKLDAAERFISGALELIDEHGSMAAFFWPHATFLDEPVSEVPPITATSTMLSKQLKRSGWSFVGPTTMYAFMQAMGLVNDHAGRCDLWQAAETSRRVVARRVGVDVA